MIESESQEFIVGSFPLVYKQASLENKVEKLTKLIKQNKTLEGLSLSYPSYIFLPRVQSVITIASQVLDLENDQFVDELILGFMFSSCVTNDSGTKFKFVEYLEKAIHTQLVKFNSLKSFRYHTYILHLFLYQNESKLQDIEINSKSQSDDVISIISWCSTIKN